MPECDNFQQCNCFPHVFPAVIVDNFRQKGHCLSEGYVLTGCTLLYMFSYLTAAGCNRECMIRLHLARSMFRAGLEETIHVEPKEHRRAQREAGRSMLAAESLTPADAQLLPGRQHVWRISGLTRGHVKTGLRKHEDW